MEFKVIGFSVFTKKAENGIEYSNYYINCTYPLNADRGVGFGTKQYVVPKATIMACLNTYKDIIKKDIDLIGKNCEFYMNEQYKNSSFQTVGLIIVK